jgi:hypothetical protein
MTAMRLGIVFATLVALAACNDPKSKVEAAADQAGRAVDKLEGDVIAGHLAARWSKACPGT